MPSGRQPGRTPAVPRPPCPASPSCACHARLRLPCSLPNLPLPLTLRLQCLLPCCSESDKERLRFLYEEWAHPYFVSKEEYGRIMEVGGTSGTGRHTVWGHASCGSKGSCFGPPPRAPSRMGSVNQSEPSERWR